MAIPVSNLMRQANTARVQDYLTNQRQSPLPMPPIRQPNQFGARPNPPSQITPITLPGARPNPILPMPPVHQPPIGPDPLTPGITPSTGLPGAGGTIDPTTFPFAGGGTTPSTNPNPAWITYQSLMRSAGRPLGANNAATDPVTGGPIASGSGDEPTLPQDPGEIDPPNLIPPNYQGPPMIGPHDDNYGLDPASEAGSNPHEWQTSPGDHRYLPGHGPGGSLPPPDLPDDHSGDPPAGFPPEHSWEDQPPDNSGIGNPGDTGGTFPTFGGGPWVPGNGGRVGSGTTDPRPWYNQASEPWYGKLARGLIPYGIGQGIHLGADLARRLALSGTVGGQAHVRGGTANTASHSATPAPTVQPSGGTHWDYGAGRYVRNDNATGAQFQNANDPNFQDRAFTNMLMWSQNMHQPTNLRQSDSPSRFLDGVWHRDENGGMTRVGERTPGARSTSGTLIAGPGGNIDAYNRLALLANRNRLQPFAGAGG